MTNQQDDYELERLIRDANERAHSGRLERVSFLMSEADSEPVPFPALVYEYYEEARLCWYMGAFVAAIVMSQLAFEETLRSHYRVKRGVDGKLNEHKKLNEAGFADLIKQAGDDGWLSLEEAAALNRYKGLPEPIRTHAQLPHSVHENHCSAVGWKRSGERGESGHRRTD